MLSESTNILQKKTGVFTRNYIVLKKVEVVAITTIHIYLQI